MTATLTPDLRTRLDAHLDAVERALLAANTPRERRRGIVDDLETQIQDMLAAQSESPTLADLDAVLAQLDPPGAYGEGAPRAPAAAMPPVTPRLAAAAVSARPRYSRTAIWGLVFILLSFLPLPLVAIGAFYVAAARSPQPLQVTQPPTVPGNPELPQPVIEHHVEHPNLAIRFLGMSLLVLIGPLALALAGTVLGWIAFGQIRSSAGQLRGTGLALFDGIFYPALVLLALGLLVA